MTFRDEVEHLLFPASIPATVVDRIVELAKGQRSDSLPASRLVPEAEWRALLNLEAQAHRVVPLECAKGSPTVEWIERWQDFKNTLDAVEQARRQEG